MKPVDFQCTLDIVRAVPLPPQGDETEERWMVEGFAATTDIDLQGEEITQAAIESSSKDLLENSTVLFNHKDDYPVGRVVKADARPGGLFIRVLVSKTVPDIWQKVKEGVLNKFSIRGKVLSAVKKFVPALNRWIRVIKRMLLVETSLVSVPANPKAKAMRWYIEKALEEFEKSGGTLESENEDFFEDGGQAMENGTKSDSAQKSGLVSKVTEILDRLLPSAVDDKMKSTLEQIKGLASKLQGESVLLPSTENKFDAKSVEEVAAAFENASTAAQALFLMDSLESKDEAMKTEFGKLRELLDSRAKAGGGTKPPDPEEEAKAKAKADAEKEAVEKQNAKEKWAQIAFLVDKLLPGEGDPRKKVILQQIKAMALRAIGQEYPYPSPYPYPQAAGAKTEGGSEGEPQLDPTIQRALEKAEKVHAFADAMLSVGQLIDGEKDPAKVSALNSLQSFLAGFSSEGLTTAPSAPPTEPPSGGDEETQKAGRKMSDTNLKVLSGIQETLAKLVEKLAPKKGEEEGEEGKKQAAKDGEEDEEEKKKKTAKGEGGEAAGEGEALQKVLGGLEALGVRLDKIEKVAGVKKSLSGQEDLAKSGGDGKGVFSGILGNSFQRARAKLGGKD